MAGAITFSCVGTFDISGGTLASAMGAETTGAATAGTSTTTYFPMMVGGTKVVILKMVRAG